MPQGRGSPRRFDEVRRLSLDASPLAWLDGHEPPFLLFHGMADTLIPVSESEMLLQKIIESGGQASLITVAKARHGFFGWPSSPQEQATWQQTLDFLDAQGVGTK